MDRNGSLAQCLQFMRRHWWHLLILPPMAILVTIVHEFSHSIAAWGQGGTVTEFVFMPTGDRWGHMRYEFDAGVEYSAVAITLMPYVVWTIIAASALLVARLRTEWSFRAGSAVFIWLYLIPLADIANASFAWLTGSPNDFGNAFGSPGLPAWLLVLLASAAAGVVGYPLQQRLYRPAALSPAAYGILGTATVIGVAVVSTGGRLLL